MRSPLGKLFGFGGKSLAQSVTAVPRVARSQNLLSTEFGQLLLKIDGEIRERVKHSYYDLKPSDSATYKELKKDVCKATEFARFLFSNRKEIFCPVSGETEWLASSWRGFATFTGLMRATLDLAPEEILDWLATIERESGKGDRNRRVLRLQDWPVSYMVQMIERKAKKTPLSDEAREKLRAVLDWRVMGRQRSHYGNDFAKVRKRIEGLLGDGGGVSSEVLPYKKLSGDQFGDPLEAELKALDAEEAGRWHRTFNIAASADGGKPTKAFLSDAQTLKDDLGKEWVRTHVQDWIARALSAKAIEEPHTNNHGGRASSWATNSVFTRSNVTLLKGLVWIADGYQDSKTVNLVADLCERSMKKVPGVGPAAQATANACLWYLENTPGAEATARLSRLGTAIKQRSVQKKIAAIVEKKADAAGITTIQLEERVVPTYGLTAGEKTIAFEDFSLLIRVEGPGKVSQTWLKSDGTPQKTQPKVTKEKAALKAKLTKLCAEIAAMKKILTAQRDRIDRLFAEEVEWPLEEVETYYVCHDLLAPVAGKLLWQLTTDGQTTTAHWLDGTWTDVAGDAVATNDTTTARLWHPIDWSVEVVMGWRERLALLGIVQPIKQAHREVYLLTDAERTTRVYSNRMAAHMLKQHQMATLMAARGWRYQLMGVYDDGLDDQWAQKSFVTTDLTAEYLMHTNWDVENWNDAGIYLYVGTDQLRFTRGAEPVDLETVPPRILSETMREADLFVAVASVGNDPAWHDQGPTPESRNYWQSYAFGTLDGFAETRKQVLRALLPRLKIRDVAHIDGKFLIVDGKLNSYKIHLGSSNILMMPGDRYLCIVPGGVAKAGNVALPFEGDNRLSVILSKALMLADDDKITARDITSQLMQGR